MENVWYRSDVTQIVFNFLRSGDCDRIASVHPWWHRLARERRLTCYIHNGALGDGSVRRATEMLARYVRLTRRLRIRLGADLRTERRLYGVPNMVTTALITACDTEALLQLERLELDLECANPSVVDRAIRIIVWSGASLRRLSLSFGRRQINVGTVLILGAILRLLQLERLVISLSFQFEQATRAPELIGHLFHVDSPYVYLECVVGVGFQCIFSRLLEVYFESKSEAAFKGSAHGRHLDIVFVERDSHNLFVCVVMLLCKLSVFDRLCCTVRCNVHPRSLSEATTISSDFFLRSTLRFVTVQLAGVGLTVGGFVSLWRAIALLPLIETFECDACDNPIGQRAFDISDPTVYPAIAPVGKRMDPVNAAGLRQLRVYITGNSAMESVAEGWNRWIRGLCPLLGDGNGIVVSAPSLPSPVKRPFRRFSADEEANRRSAMTNNEANKRTRHSPTVIHGT